jgi:antitoxin (DNA-binding transcriptional repressor) of toxin-antitoxin stability system
MHDSLSISEARAVLPRIIERVQAGDEVTITRHGEAVAVIVRPDTLRTRRVGDLQRDMDRIRETLATGRRTPLAPRGTLSEQRAEELVAEVRAGRSSR